MIEFNGRERVRLNAREMLGVEGMRLPSLSPRRSRTVYSVSAGFIGHPVNRRVWRRGRTTCHRVPENLLPWAQVRDNERSLPCRPTYNRICARQDARCSGGGGYGRKAVDLHSGKPSNRAVPKAV
jgi:hypothetical protein